MMTLRVPSRARYLILLSMISLFLSGCVCYELKRIDGCGGCDEHEASHLVTEKLQHRMKCLAKEDPFKHSLMLYEYREVRSTYYACNCEQAIIDANSMIDKIDNLLKEDCK